MDGGQDRPVKDFPQDYHEGRNSWQKEMKHEQLYRFPSGFAVRWCAHHAILHGYLYDCPYFSDEVRAQIREQDRKKVAALSAGVALYLILIILLLIS